MPAWHGLQSVSDVDIADAIVEDFLAVAASPARASAASSMPGLTRAQTRELFLAACRAELRRSSPATCTSTPAATAWRRRSSRRAPSQPRPWIARPALRSARASCARSRRPMAPPAATPISAFCCCRAPLAAAAERGCRARPARRGLRVVARRPRRCGRRRGLRRHPRGQPRRPRLGARAGRRRCADASACSRRWRWLPIATGSRGVCERLRRSVRVRAAGVLAARRRERTTTACAVTHCTWPFLLIFRTVTLLRKHGAAVADAVREQAQRLSPSGHPSRRRRRTARTARFRCRLEAPQGQSGDDGRPRCSDAFRRVASATHWAARAAP